MKLLIASDHAGFDLKKIFIEAATSLGVEWIDLGPHDSQSVDYPKFAEVLCEQLLATHTLEQRLKPCGVLICGSGVGMSIAANRFEGIRAVLTQSVDVAKLSRQHNASNVLCLGARATAPEHAQKILQAWITTDFEGGRHQRRIDLMDHFAQNSSTHSSPRSSPHGDSTPS